MEILVNILGGLGLFFIGIASVSQSLRQLTGSTFRRLMARAGDHPLAAAIIGTLAGVLLQSSNAVTFIIIGLINTKALDARRGLPMVAWANVGTSALVLLASMNLRLMALFLLASTGLAMHLSRDKSRYRYVLAGLMGLGLLLMGTDLIKVGAKPLQDVADFRNLIAYGVQSQALSIMLGMVLAVFTQSTSTVAVAAIGMTQSGLFGLDQTLLLVYGANIGSGISTALMAANLSGTGRQLAYFQCAFKSIGSLLLIGLFYLETVYHWPLLKALVADMDGALGAQIAWAYFFMQLAGVAGTMPISAWLLGICQRLSPPTRHEELSSPQYLYDQALEDPPTAITLAECEIRDIVARISELLPYDGAMLDSPGRQTLLHGSLAVLQETRAFLAEMLEYQPDLDVVELNLKLQTRCELIVQLMETTHQLGITLGGLPGTDGMIQIRDSVVEGLHVILLTLNDSVAEQGADGIPLLLLMTEDHTEIMQRLRDSLMHEAGSLHPANYQSLLNVTILLERSIWLIRRLVLTLKS
ncbi:MAG: Na/Pi symporter [Methylovulum sp.]|nr:Na/Pi symporter [Methylovulum sp.]